MPNTREKLIELVAQVQDCGCDVTDVVEMNYVENDVLVDHLIANGVTIPVRCKECKHMIHNSNVYPQDIGCLFFRTDYGIEPEHFCSHGERRNDG